MTTDREPVASPCVNVCALSTDGRYCLGCFRSLEEIARWSSLDDAARRAVLAACEARIEALFGEPE